MNRLLSTSAILAMALVLDSCAVLQRTLQVPGRMMRAGMRTMTGSVQTPEAVEARVAARLSEPDVR